MNTLLKSFFLFTVLFVLTLVSCSSPFSQQYFMQQQGKIDKEEDGPDIDWGDDDTEEEVPPPSGTYSIFAALASDGTVDATGMTGISPEAIAALAAKLPPSSAGNYPASNFGGWAIRSTFSGSNVPSFSFVTGNPWANGDVPRSESWYNGPNSNAGSNSITNMVYYRYKGKNPLFSPDSTYNSAEYATASGSKEKTLARFEFYRFSGKGGGVAALDNMLVAFDTYSKYIFAFAKPTKTESLLGQQVPKEWGPVDLVSTGPGGVKYKFYEYDPAGHVKSDGSVVMYPWYTEAMGRGSYDPVFTGKSPYLGTLGGSGGETGGGYEVTGTLTVKAKYLRNNSVTDAWGDHGNADSTDSPEFIYNIRSRAYSGFEMSKWDSLSSFKPDNPSIAPAAAEFIKKGQTRSLGGVKSYVFDKDGGNLSLELDSRIVEIDIAGNDWVTDYETPIIFFSYDRFTHKWTPKTDNNTFIKGNSPVSYDKNFSVGNGEKKDFLITLPVGTGGEKMTLCYEVSWVTDGSTAQGQVVSAELVNMTPSSSNPKPEYLIEFTSGAPAEYTLDLTDNTIASSQTGMKIQLQLKLGNMLSELRPVTVKSSPSGSVIKNFRMTKVSPVSSRSLLNFVTCSGDSALVNIEFEIYGKPDTDQTEELTILFDYEDGYDTVNSPKKLTVKVTRNKYVPMKRYAFGYMKQ